MLLPRFCKETHNLSHNSNKNKNTGNRRTKLNNAQNTNMCMVWFCIFDCVATVGSVATEEDISDIVLSVQAYICAFKINSKN